MTDTAIDRPWRDIPSERIGEGVDRQMVVGERLMMCRLTLQPHVDTPVHSHPHEQMTVIERGRVAGMISIGDLVKAVIEDQQHTIEQLESYIHS